MSLATAKPFAVAHWALDETGGTRVDSLTGNDLTDNNTVLSAAGKFSNAADFESATTEYLSRSDSADVSAGDIKFFLRIWVNLESKDDSGGIIGKWGVGTHEYLLFYRLATDRFSFAVSHDGSTTAIQDADNLGIPSLGTWYLLHAWHDSVANQIGIAVNAGTANTLAHSTGILDSTSDFLLGANSDSGGVIGQHFDGLMDDAVILKDYILDATERTEDYNSGTGVAFADWDAGGGVTVPALDEGMLTGGLMNMSGGLA